MRAEERLGVEEVPEYPVLPVMPSAGKKQTDNSTKGRCLNKQVDYCRPGDLRI